MSHVIIEALKNHNAAMDLCSQSLAAKRQDRDDDALRLLTEAYALEKIAAEQIMFSYFLQPTRGILLRSTVKLALEVEEYRDAERFCAAALASDLPESMRCDFHMMMQTAVWMANQDAAAEAFQAVKKAEVRE